MKISWNSADSDADIACLLLVRGPSDLVVGVTRSCVQPLADPFLALHFTHCSWAPTTKRYLSLEKWRVDIFVAGNWQSFASMWIAALEAISKFVAGSQSFLQSGKEWGFPSVRGWHFDKIIILTRWDRFWWDWRDLISFSFAYCMTHMTHIGSIVTTAE